MPDGDLAHGTPCYVHSHLTKPIFADSTYQEDSRIEELGKLYGEENLCSRIYVIFAQYRSEGAQY